MSQTRVLLVTSASAPEGAVVPVLAALEAAGLEVRAIDIGRAGASADNALDKVVRAFAGELAERRLMHEISAHPPDVAVTFDPITTMAMTVVRDEAARPAPVVAVVADLEPSEDWGATAADRYLAMDDEAAVSLAEHGVEGERILTVGVVCERAFVEAAAQSRQSIRQRFKLDARAPVVLIQITDLGYDLASQIALQLSLLGNKDVIFLFDAGSDADAATALRRQVPTLGIKAKMFGATDDVSLLWRAADIVVARPRDAAVSRALVLGAWLVALMPEDGRGEALARAVEARGLGKVAGNALFLSSALEALFGKSRPQDERVATDGAATVADIAWIVGTERREVLDERRRAERASTRARVSAAASAAEAAARATAAAGGLEDLSGDEADEPADDVPSREDVSKLRAEVSARLGQVSKAVLEARQAAENRDKQREQASLRGDSSAAREAERAADAERARMHSALKEMAELQAELKRLEKAAAHAASAPPGAGRSKGHERPGTGQPRPGSGASTGSRPSSTASVDDMLGDLRRRSGQAQTTIDDELEALKRRMATQRNQRKP